ncbi:MAG TPA: extracellular solute-binding protein [Chloroflexota bacterium]|nr:extracellular solute-binding protein [Chloroflexota bacterium]
MVRSPFDQLRGRGRHAPLPGAARLSRRQWHGLAGAMLGGAAGAACGTGQGAPSGGGAAQPTLCHSRMEMIVAAAPGQPRYEAYSDALKSFTRPNCTVELSVVPSAELLAKVTASVAAGEPPAMTEMPNGATPLWVANGLLASVDDLFRRDKLSQNDFPPAMWKVMSYNNKVWFLPGSEANADFILFWNKQHFREAGLDPDKGPTTIAELDAMALKLTRESGGTLDRVAMKPWDVYGIGNSIQGWGYAMGAQFYDEQKDELTFTHPRIQRAVEWMADWARRLGFERVAAFQASVQQQPLPFFASGRLSIAPLVSVHVRDSLRNDPSMELGAGPLPGEAPGKPGAVAMGGWVVATLAGSKQREEAWDGLKHIGVSDEGTLGIARRGGIPGYLKSPGLNELSGDPLFKHYVEGVRRAEFPQVSFYTPGGWSSAAIQEAVEGKRPVKEALEETNRDANQRHTEWKSRTKK